MKKKYIIIIFVMVLLTSSFVYGEDYKEVDANKEYDDTLMNEPFKASKSALPDIERIYSEELNSYKYITKYKDRFSLDYKESWFGLDSDEIYNSNANVMFSVQQSFVETMIFLVDKVYNFKVYKLFEDLVKEVIGILYNKSAWMLINIVLALMGLYFSYKMILNQKSEFWATLVKTILIISIGLLFFNKPNLILSKIDYLMNNISNQILEAQSDFTDDYDKEVDPSVSLANLMWEQYVLKPWQFLEFGDMDMAEEYTDEILSMSPGSDERVDRLNEIFEKEGVDTYTMSTERLSFVCMYYIPLMANIVMISLMSILIIGYQFLTIVMFLLGIFVMIVALFPSGTNILKMWASKVFGFAAMKVFLTFLFTVLIAVNNILFDNSKNEGWAAVLVLQVMFYLIIFLKRNELISIFVNVQSDFSNPYMALNKLRSMREMPFMYNNYSKNAGNKENNGNNRGNDIYRYFNKDRDRDKASVSNRGKRHLSDNNNTVKESEKPVNNIKKDYVSEKKIPSTRILRSNIKPRNQKAALKHIENLKSKDDKKDTNKVEIPKSTETNFNMKRHIRKLKNNNTVNIRKKVRYKNIRKRRTGKDD